MAEELRTWRTGALRARDAERMLGVHPYLQTRIARVLDAMEILGFPMFVNEAVRSLEQQQARYAQGRTTPGKIVSNADGIPKNKGGTGLSMHQHQADGFGHAVDCAFIDDPLTVKIETWDPAQPWELYGKMAEAYGLTWGGRWQTLLDRPHVELPINSPHAKLL